MRVCVYLQLEWIYFDAAAVAAGPTPASAKPIYGAHKGSLFGQEFLCATRAQTLCIIRASNKSGGAACLRAMCLARAGSRMSRFPEARRIYLEILAARCLPRTAEGDIQRQGAGTHSHPPTH
jgi:hypothetical protein